MTIEPHADTPTTAHDHAENPATTHDNADTPTTGHDDADTPATTHDNAAGSEGEGWQVGLNLTGSLREAMRAPPTVYEIVGGQPFFDELVDRFYDAVEDDARLRPMYPRDMGPSRRRLAGFLAQYWGGPPHYSDERGHPRLRMRHFPFAIGWAERDAWMAHMTASLDAATIADGTGRPLPAEIRAAMFDHFDNAATHLINQPVAGPPQA